MPRGNVSDGITHLSDSIVACGVLPLLARFRKHGWKDRPTPAALLACYAAFAADEASFGPAERTILREFEVECMGKADWWARLVVAVSEPEPNQPLISELVDLHAKLRLVADTLPNIIAEATVEPVQPGMAMVRVLLPTNEGIPAHPLRLSTAIEAVCILWSVLGDITGDRTALNMVSCKPQPEIAVTFAGPSDQVAELKALLMEVWENIVTSRSATLEERIAIIPRSLPAMQRIGMEGEDAAARRYALENGVRMFLEVGACIPEMDDPERFSPARLLQVSATLESDSTQAVARGRPIAAGDDTIEAIVAEERAFLRQAVPDHGTWISKARAG